MTDVESSTQAWDESPASARKALEHHDRIVTGAVEQSGGQMVESGREGDSILAVFTNATGAVACALDLQRALQRQPWPDERSLRVRVALHTGAADLENGHYVGIALYRCARIMATAHGGQTLLSTATRELVADALPGGVTLLDLGAHQLRDLSRPEHVYQLLHPDLQRDFPPLKSAAAFPNNLPNLLTTFVDREEELRRIRSLLRSSRLVTVTGTGGAGKSRLAIEVAKASQDLWPDGRWWLELTTEEDVAAALVARLELPGRGAPLDVVSSWLANKRALVIFDNCEHIVETCARVCEALLARSPDLAILATSREPLRVQGEARWPLASLADADALSLFEARARLVRPSFSAGLSPSTVSQICRRLDSLPLAIEMAAARVDAMSELELLDDLTKRFGSLESASRTGPERQQTMTATIDWSHRLLKPDEARVFRRLAVFDGGFTMDAAEVVCGEGVADVRAVVGALAQKSMVVAESAGDRTRYRLLEWHLDFARHKLREAGEERALEERHYGYFRSATWTPADSSNFWRAVTWAEAHAVDGGLGLALEIADSDFSAQARAKDLILALLKRPQTDATLKARALTMAARLAYRQAENAEARSLAASAIAAARETGDADLVGRALNGAGLIHETSGDLAVAQRMYDEALAVLRESSDRVLREDVSNHRALLAIIQGDPAGALAILRPCVEGARAAADAPRLARYLDSAANAELDAGDADAAAASWTEALTVFAAVNDWFGIIWSLVGLCLVAAARQEDERSLRLVSAAKRLAAEYSLGMWPYRIAQLEASLKEARRRLGNKERADAAWSEGASMTTPEVIAYALTAERPTAGEKEPETGPLSRREREVVALVAAGLTNREIARRLYIAERTAEGHVERIRNKLGLRSRTEVATWAVTHGIKPAVDNPPRASKV